VYAHVHGRLQFKKESKGRDTWETEGSEEANTTGYDEQIFCSSHNYTSTHIRPCAAIPPPAAHFHTFACIVHRVECAFEEESKGR
jgi:hypothetical protein